MAVGARRADYREPDLNRLGAEALDDAAADELAAAFETRTAAVAAALHGWRLDRALVALAPEFSRNHLQHLIDAGHVRLDGMPAATASRRVRAGQQLTLELVPTEESRA